MVHRILVTRLMAICPAALPAACSEEAPVALHADARVRPGKAYSEAANEVHRAVVVSAEPAVVVVTRFNIPVGGAITIPAEDPGCD